MNIRKAAKWAGITLAGLLVLLVLVLAGVQWRGRTIVKGGPEIAVKSMELNSDSASLERGRHIVEAIAPCAACHGAGLKGSMFETPPILVAMAAPNLTTGKGGVGTNQVADWDRALRHGVGKDGRRLIIMPSDAYAHLSDADFNAVVAYLNTVPPVDNETPPRKVGLLGATLVGGGVFPIAANVIKHDEVGTRAVPEGETREYGEYLVEIATCKHCHGPDLGGMKSDGGPGGPSLLTTAKTWTVDQFRQTIRNGRTPQGRQLDPKLMPWPFYAKMTDAELHAVWLYIRSMPDRAVSAE